MSAITEFDTDSRLAPLPASLDSASAFSIEAGMLTPSAASQSALPQMVVLPSNCPDTPASPSFIPLTLIGSRERLAVSSRIVLA